jgi:small subunit ribosomal protein S2
MTSVSMRQMLEAGVHFGHQTRFWNPKMAPFIFGERNKIHIINLEKTQPLYARRRPSSRALCRRRRQGAVRRHQALGPRCGAEGSRRCGHAYVNQRWLGGMLTNFKTIRQSIKRLNELDEMASFRRAGQARQERSQMLRREMDKLCAAWAASAI